MTESKVGGNRSSSFALAVEGPYPLALDRKAPPTDMRDAHPRAGEMPTSSPGTGTEHNLPGHEHTSSDTTALPRTPEKQRESHREQPLKNEQQGHQERPQNDEEQERRPLKRNTGRPRPGMCCYCREEEPYPPPTRLRSRATMTHHDLAAAEHHSVKAYTCRNTHPTQKNHPLGSPPTSALQPHNHSPEEPESPRQRLQEENHAKASLSPDPPTNPGHGFSP